MWCSKRGKMVSHCLSKPIGQHLTLLQKYELLHQERPHPSQLIYRYDPPLLIVEMANQLNLGGFGSTLKGRFETWYSIHSDMVSMFPICRCSL